MLPRLWLLVGSDRPRDRPRDRQCQLLSCPGQLKIYLLTKGLWNYMYKMCNKIKESAPLTFWTMLNEWFSHNTRILHFLCENFSNVLMFSNIKHSCRSKKEWDLGQLKGCPKKNTNQILSESRPLVHCLRDRADSCVFFKLFCKTYNV